MPSVKRGFVLPLVRRLQSPHHIVFNNHSITVGVPGDYLCTYSHDDTCKLEWIESHATIYCSRYYTFEYGIADESRSFFALARVRYVTPGKTLRISRNGKFIILAYPNDVIMEISSGARFLIEVRGNRKKTSRLVPLQVNNAWSRPPLIIEPA